MVGRVNSDGILGATTVDPYSRVEIAIPGVSATAELPKTAITEVTKSENLPSELPPFIHDKAKIIGQIQYDMKVLEQNSSNSKELEAIKAKLLLGHESAIIGDVNNPAVVQAMQSIDRIHVLGKSKSTDLTGLKSSATGQIDNQPTDPNIVGIADQQKVIGRIDDALMVVDKLLGQLDTDQLASKTRLLNLTGTVVGLNAARSTVDKTPLSLSVAMNAAEMIMTNVKTAVMSHANINTDIVRLVMG
jgi:hypothetical protein